MARLAFLLLPIASFLASALAGPACARKHWQSSECIQRCQNKWGYPGHMMGNDPWGNIIQSTSTEAWNSYISQACGSPGETLQGNLGGPATPESTTLVLSTTEPQSTYTSTYQVPETTSSVTTSSSFTQPPPEPTTSSSAPPPPPPSTSSEPPPPPTTSEAPPPPEITSEAPPPPETTQEPTPTTSQAPPPAETQNPGGNGSGGGDIDEFLSAHNNFRAQHGADPLTWSDDVAAKAQEWANKCVFEHSGGQLGELGENLAAGTGDYTISKAVKAWTDEAPDYNPSSPNPSHFTQVVWKGSRQLGCATQICDFLGANTLHVVCEYSPPGNMIGAFAENVQA